MHHWKNLEYDILDLAERAEYLSTGDRSLPITHEVNPLEHAELCVQFSSGQLGNDGYPWHVFARVELDTSATITKDGAGCGHPDVDTSTLAEAHSMMVNAAAHATERAFELSKPTAEKASKPPPSKPKTAAKRRK